MIRENIIFFENDDDDESYTMTNKYLCNEFFGYKYSCYHNYIHADKILLFKKCDYKYFIRYNDVSDIKIRPLQLKIDNFYGEICKNANNNMIVYIYSDDKNSFKKCREIWNNITESIGLNNSENFVETTKDNDDEYIQSALNKNTNFVKVNHKNKNELIIVSDSIVNGFPQTSIVQYKYNT